MFCSQHINLTTVEKKKPNELTILIFLLFVFFFRLQLLEMLKFYSRFEINDESGDALTDHDMTQIHYSKIISLQVRNTTKKKSIACYTWL